jgi:hypothetical protein
VSEGYRKVHLLMNDVTIGSVWADTDPRQVGRTVEVVGFGMDREGSDVAIVRLNTPADSTGRNAIGRRTRIRLDRFDGKEYVLSDVEPHRFGTVGDAPGYWPLSQLAASTRDGQ